MSVALQKKILFISFDGLTDPLGQSQIIPYLHGLAQDFKISVISAEKNFDRALLRNFKNEILSTGMDWYPIHYSKRFPFISQWLTLKRLQRKAFKLSSQEKFELVHVRSYVPMLIAEKLKEKFQTKILFDMRGLWADERVEGNIWNLKRIWYRKLFLFFKRKEKQWLRESDAIVVLTEAAKNYLVSSEKIFAEKITVVPCCADLNFFNADHIDHDRQNILKIQLGIYENDFILCYSGSLGTWYLTDEMMHFFKILIEKKPEWKFLFITPEKQETILEAAKKYSVNEEKIIVKKANHDEMPVLLSLADVGIFFIQNSFSKIASSPTKMAEYLAMGIPIISNAGVGDDDQIIRFPENGILLNDFSGKTAEETASKMDELLSIPNNKIRATAEKYFNLESGIQRYKRIYQTL